MEISFSDRKLADSNRRRVKYSNNNIYRKIDQRISTLAAAPNLATLAKEHPQLNCHEYTGKEKGTYTVDLNGPLRLWFCPEPPIPYREDGGIDTLRVTSIIIIDVINPH
jgi:plasmid maintenance system killer protein